MKKLLVLCSSIFVSLGCFAQGQIAFDTFIVDFKIVGCSAWFDNGVHEECYPASQGKNLIVELGLVFGEQYVPLVPTTTFYGTDVPEALRYYVIPPPNGVTVPGVRSGDTASFQLRVKDSQAPFNYLAATPTFELTVGGGLIVPPNLEPLAGKILWGYALDSSDHNRLCSAV